MMPGYRQLHSKMWSSDQWFGELSAEKKLLFVYLFSNERASVSGLYEAPLRVIAFETGLDAEVIRSGFEAFDKAGKVHYDFEFGVVWVRNMFKYQGSQSPKVIERAKKDVASVPECPLKDKWLSENTLLIGYPYGIEEEGDGIDTSSYSSSSSSISSSDSREGGGTGEETQIPETPRQAAEHPDIQVYEQISGRFPGERDYRVIIETMQYLREKHGPSLTDYLAPYWTAWSTRKTKDKRPYSKSSLVWLCEWAMQGEIPRANGHEPQSGELLDRASIIKKVSAS